MTINAQQRQRIYRCIEEALPFYHRWKRARRIASTRATKQAASHYSSSGRAMRLGQLPAASLADERAEPPARNVYLQVLEPAIEGYLYGRWGVEQDVIDLWLDGLDDVRILKFCKTLDPNLTLKDVRVWIYGDGEQYGLLNTMCEAFMADADFCPFCMDQKGRGDRSVKPKLYGTTCPHAELWEHQRLQESA